MAYKNPYYSRLDSHRVERYIRSHDLPEKSKIFWKDMETVDIKTPFTWQRMLYYIDEHPDKDKSQIEKNLLSSMYNYPDDTYDYWVRLDLLEESGLIETVSYHKGELLLMTDLGKRFVSYMKKISPDMLEKDSKDYMFSKENLTFFDL